MNEYGILKISNQENLQREREPEENKERTNNKIAGLYSNISILNLNVNTYFKR